MTNLQKLINVAIAEVMETAISKVYKISDESVNIIKTSLEVYRQKMEDEDGEKKSRCRYCRTGMYLDEYGRIMQGYSFCPKCGCELKSRE